MAATGGFRPDLSITRKTDGNVGNVSMGVLFSKSRINENGGKQNTISKFYFNRFSQSLFYNVISR